MPRQWIEGDFLKLYEKYVCTKKIQPDGKEYYRRYRSRYQACLQRFAEIAPSSPINVLDIGVGQLALLCHKLWGDHTVVADLPGGHLSYMEDCGVETVCWNLCKYQPPFESKFDAVFFSEVIEHLPIPGHIVLERLKTALRPGGFIICTTPNLYRLRNVVFMALGRRIFDNFQIPEDDTGLSHVLEYSRDHLKWQFGKAGYTRCTIEYRQMHRSPTKPVHRLLSILGYPLHAVPRWRDNLLAVAYRPE